MAIARLIARIGKLWGDIGRACAEAELGL